MLTPSNVRSVVRGRLLSSGGLLTSILLSRDPALLRLPRLPARTEHVTGQIRQTWQACDGSHLPSA